MANARIAAAYDYLRTKAQSGDEFRVSDIAEATNWAESTVRTYLRKQWEVFVRLNGSAYKVDKNFLDYPLDVFERINSQKFLINKDPFKPNLGSVTEGLIAKSRESALLAVQVYNNPLLTFRTPSFIVHMVIAYTSLFHAIFEEQGKKYVFLDANGQEKVTATGQPWLWDLGECIKQYWGGENSGIRENLRLFIELRNEIEHRYAPAFDITIAEHCQALLLNYEDLITQNFSPYYALGAGISIPLQLTRESTSARIDAMRELQRNDYEFLNRTLGAFCDALHEDIRSSAEFQFRLMLIQVPANHVNTADVSMRFVRFEDLTEEVRSGLQSAATLIKTKTVEAANAGTLKPSAVVKLIQEMTDSRFRMHEHTLAWKYFEVRPREPQAEGCKTEFCHFDEPHGDVVYTMKWVEKLKEAVADAAVYAAIRAYKDP